MIFHGPIDYDYDIDLGPVILSDCRFELCIWGKSTDSQADYHKDYFHIVEYGAFPRVRQYPVLDQSLTLYSREYKQNLMAPIFRQQSDQRKG